MLQSVVLRTMILSSWENHQQPHPDYDTLCRNVLKNIGLEDLDRYKIQELISVQSPDIAMGVDHDGAGDQGMMFGYATKETKEMLPIPMFYPPKLCRSSVPLIWKMPFLF